VAVELKQQSRRWYAADGFAFVPIVPFSWTAFVGLPNRAVKWCGKLHLPPTFRSKKRERSVRPRKNSARAVALKLRSVDKSFNALLWLFNPTSCVADHQPEPGRIMAKRKKGSKVQSRAKLRRANSAKRGKARKAARAKTVAKAKPKRAPVKKAARKVKPPVAPVVESVAETVAVEVIEQPVAVTEVDEIRKAS
jgi:hypothetical protein